MIQSILTAKQTLLIRLFSANSNIQRYFYLSGGTALSEYYLHHRLSEDLDFFTETEIKSISSRAGIKKVDFQQSFNRNLIYLHFDNEIVKTEFTYYPFTQLEQSKTADGIKIDSLLDIAVNKTFTIYQKPRGRDFIDLYLIIKEKEWSFTDLRKKARSKFETHMDPLQMAKQLLEADIVVDYPRMLLPLEPKIWQDFWKQEAAKLKNEALV